MGFIGEVTFINQNMHIPSAVMADAMAREHLNVQFNRELSKVKDDKIKEVREVEESAEVSTNTTKQEEEEKHKNIELAKRKLHHLDLKG